MYIGTVRRKIFFTATFQPFSAFHCHPRFKTAAFLESGRDHGHLATLRPVQHGTCVPPSRLEVGCNMKPDSDSYSDISDEDLTKIAASF
jgi:hypothetical protein